MEKWKAGGGCGWCIKKAGLVVLCEHLFICIVLAYVAAACERVVPGKGLLPTSALPGFRCVCGH